MGGSGGQLGCDGPEATIQDITSGTIVPNTKVTLKGVVAMSEKWNVSHGSSCIWGVFVSAPGLSETAPNTGVLALSYGTPPAIPPGGTKALCPKQTDPTGDQIPPEVKPGDILDLVGVTAYFPAPGQITCMAGEPQNTVPMRQFGQVCSAKITGSGPVPASHVLTGADLTSLTSISDKAFHDQWGGVKVRVENAAVIPSGSPPAVVGAFGVITVQPGIPFGDKMYYRGYGTSICHAGPVYTDTGMTFNAVEGFHYLDFCEWGLAVADKCADLEPPSTDCGAVTSCVGTN